MPARKYLQKFGFAAYIEIQAMKFVVDNPIPRSWGLEGDPTDGWASLWLTAAFVMSENLFFSKPDNRVRPVSCAFFRPDVGDQPEQLKATVWDLRALQDANYDYNLAIRRQFMPLRAMTYNRQKSMAVIRMMAEHDLAKEQARERTEQLKTDDPLMEVRPNRLRVRIEEVLPYLIKQQLLPKNEKLNANKLFSELREEEQRLDAHRERIGLKLLAFWPC